MPSSEKEPPLAYICALVSAAHPSISKEVEGHKNNFVCLRVPDVSFYEVEGHKLNFVSLSGS